MSAGLLREEVLLAAKIAPDQLERKLDEYAAAVRAEAWDEGASEVATRVTLQIHNPHKEYHYPTNPYRSGGAS